MLLAESAETQDRTGDTAIFSRVLYQLSYLGQISGYKACKILLDEDEIVKQGAQKASNQFSLANHQYTAYHIEFSNGYSVIRTQSRVLATPIKNRRGYWLFLRVRQLM